MAATLRERIRERYGRRCGYCGVHESEVGATLTFDHHRPQVRGGREAEDNLVYCCPRCNEHKGKYWHETDPPHLPLLHPRRDDVSEHVVEEANGRLLGLTPAGAFYIDHLQLNRAPQVARRLREQGSRALTDELARLQQQNAQLRQRLGSLAADLAEVRERLHRRGMPR